MDHTFDPDFSLADTQPIEFEPPAAPDLPVGTQRALGLMVEVIDLKEAGLPLNPPQLIVYWFARVVELLTARSRWA